MKSIQEPGPEALDQVFRLKYKSSGPLGSTPSTYRKFGYHSPDDYYEALVDQLVGNETAWLDVGCGRALFPSNPALAKELSDRCKVLVGVDPDPTVRENPLIHEAVQESIYNYRAQREFDLVTLRMVAEHIMNPGKLISSLSRCTHSGSVVVVYTVNAWSPIPFITRLTPFPLRHPLKRFLWGAEEKDTFRTAYLMNTRKRLQKLFSEANFEEVFFSYLDDCRTFSRFQSVLAAELVLYSALKRISLRYPELCLLCAYRRGDYTASET